MKDTFNPREEYTEEEWETITNPPYTGMENDGWDDDEMSESENDGQPDEAKEWEDFEGPQEDQYLDSSWEDRFETGYEGYED